MSLLLLNSELELSSFPITQKIRLKCDDPVEINDLKNSIYLINVIRKDSLLNLSAPYNFNIGLIKKEYPTIDLIFNIVQEDNYYIVEITPTKPLNVSSTYMLLIVKQLAEPFITIQKNNSKTKSNITVNPLNYVEPIPSDNYKIIITSTTAVTDVAKITKLSVFRGNTLVSNKIINTSKGSSFTVDNLSITLDSPIYVLDEEFIISITEKVSSIIDQDCCYLINTASNESITPLELTGNLPSSRVDNSSVINFYNTTLLNKPTEYTYQYLDSNIIDIKIEESIEKSQIDVNNIKMSVGVAFNNYLLSKIKLYDNTLKYILKIYWDDFEHSIRLVVLYTDEPLAPTITIDTSDW